VSGGGAVRYGGWSRDRQGWIFGLSGAAVVLIVSGGVALLLAAGAHRWLVALAWTPAWAVLVVLVAVPVRGRSALAWVLGWLSRCAGGARGWSEWQSRAAAGTVEDFTQADLPGVLSGIRVHDGPPWGPLSARPVLVADERERTWAAVARVTHPGIGLAESGERIRLGAGLSELLESAATAGLVAVVALQVRTVPDDGAERAQWQQARLHRDAPEMARRVAAQSGCGGGPGSATRGSSPSWCPRTGSPSWPRSPAAASTAGPGSCTG